MNILKSFVTVIFAFLMFSLFSAICYAQEEAQEKPFLPQQAVAVVSENLRQEPSSKSEILTVIPEGEALLVNDQIGKWFSVQYGEISGFIWWKSINFIQSPLEDTLIGNSTIHYTSSESRDTNISIACSKINGIVIQPCEQFIWSQIVGQTYEEDGYQIAPVIKNYMTVYDVGGGVCQVSTTIYNALLDTDIIPDELHQHSVGCAYAKKDATVAYGQKDFIFTNSYPYPIRLEASSYKAIVAVNIYKLEE